MNGSVSNPVECLRHKEHHGTVCRACFEALRQRYNGLRIEFIGYEKAFEEMRSEVAGFMRQYPKEPVLPDAPDSTT